MTAIHRAFIGLLSAALLGCAQLISVAPAIDRERALEVSQGILTEKGKYTLDFVILTNPLEINSGATVPDDPPVRSVGLSDIEINHPLWLVRYTQIPKPASGSVYLYHFIDGSSGNVLRTFAHG